MFLTLVASFDSWRGLEVKQSKSNLSDSRGNVDFNVLEGTGLSTGIDVVVLGLSVAVARWLFVRRKISSILSFTGERSSDEGI